MCYTGVSIMSDRYLCFLSKTTRIARLFMALYGTKLGPVNIVSLLNLTNVNILYKNNHFL